MATEFVFLLSFCHLLAFSSGHYFTVSVSCDSLDITAASEGSGFDEGQPCMGFDEAMDGLVSDSVLFLEAGSYTVTQSHNIYGVRNISLIGASENGVNMRCDGQNGLSFINITDLTIANLTLDGCGLSGPSLLDAVDTLRGILRIWTLIPSSIRIGLFLGDCKNVRMSNVAINGTQGLGMVAVNMIGSSILSNLTFTHNTRRSCIPNFPAYPFNVTDDVLNQTGGGAYFLYHDYLNTSYGEGRSFPKSNSLLISNSYFAYNTDCSLSALTHLNYKYFDKEDSRFTIGAGGGLSILYAHSEFSVSTRVEYTTFYRNDARYGAGAYIATFVDFEYPNRVVFDNCHFRENGLRSLKSVGEYCRGGAGLAILTDLFKPANIYRAIENVQNVSIFAFNTKFIENIALIEGGGIFAYSFANSQHRINSFVLPNYFSIEWKLNNCTFKRNEARLDSAASFVQRIFQSIDGIVILYLESISVVENGIGVPLLNQYSPSNEVSSAFAVMNIVTEFRGKSVFADNGVTAMHITSAAITIWNSATLLFEGNSGKRGGAMYMEGNFPVIYVLANATITYRRNSAAVEGGAIFCADSLYSSGSLRPDNYKCLVDTQPHLNSDLFSSGSRLEFFENSAPTGSAIFGTTLEVCPWADRVNAERGKLLVELYENYNSTFFFDQAPEGRDQVSTYPAKIEVTAPEEVIPGEVMNVNISAFDEFGSEILAVVASEVDNDSANSILSESGFWYTVSKTTTLRLLGTQNQVHNVTFFSYVNVVSTSVPILVLSCPAGFVYDDDTGGCECANIFEHGDGHSDLVECDSARLTYSTMFNVWIGTDTNSVNSTDSKDLIVHECFYRYCRVNSTFRPPNYDAQCTENSHRTGVLCGGCEAGYSAVFSSNECKICSNYYLFLIPTFAVIGVVLFVVILLFEITVDKGWINAVFFYCNIISLYSFVVVSDFSLQLFLLPTHLLSLQPGIGVCFYDGMTALFRTYIQLLFPVYLYILMGLYSLIASRITVSFCKNYSPTKTFVTLNVMTYASILNTCIEILSAISMHTVNNVFSLRWAIDANQVYFRGWHIPLGIIAIVISFTYLSIPILFLAPSVIYKYRFFKSGIPFFDALFAPFKQEYRFWLGIRLLTRGVLVVFSRTINTYTSLLINSIVLLILLHVQTSIKPFKSFWLNNIDSLLIVNLIIMYIGFLVNSVLPPSIDAPIQNTAYLVIFIGIAYLAIIAIFGYYIDIRFPKIRQKLLKCLQSVTKKKEAKKNVVETTTYELSAIPRTATVFDLDQPPDHGCNRIDLDRERAELEVVHYRDSILDTV